MCLKDSYDSILSKRKKKNYKWSNYLTLEGLLNNLIDYGEI